MIYQYLVFGIRVQSELELPALVSDEEHFIPEVTISLGKTPVQLVNSKEKGVAFEIGPGEFLLNLKDVARYYVSGGSTIIIEPQGKAHQDDIRLFLLGSCFGALLQQRKVLALHASAIVHDGAAVLFSGASGAGKSTTANAFRLRGYQMLTDDVCPIKIVDQKPYAMPGYPQSKLWEDALEKLKVDFSELRYIREGISKRALPIHEDFAHQPIPVKAMYVLTPHNKHELELSNVKNANKFRVVKNLTYRHFLLKNMGVQPYHFLTGSQFANTVPIKHILRPSAYCVPEVVALIENDLAAAEILNP